VRGKFPDLAENPKAGDDLSDLGPEDASQLRDLAGKALAPSPCRCESRRPERGLDGVTCGKCGRALPEGS